MKGRAKRRWNNCRRWLSNACTFTRRVYFYELEIFHNTKLISKKKKKKRRKKICWKKNSESKFIHSVSLASVDFTSFLEIGFKCGLGGKGNVGGLGSSESSSSCVWNALFPSLRARNFTAAYVWKSFFMQQVSILLEARWLSLRSHLRNPYWEFVGFFLFFIFAQSHPAVVEPS